MTAGMYPGDIATAVQARLIAEAEQLAPPAPRLLPLSTVQECFLSGERGDGLLFAGKYRSELRRRADTGDWYSYTGNHWKPDTTNAAQAGVEAVCLEYARLLEPLNQKFVKASKEEATSLLAQIRQIERRILHLRSVTGIRNTLEMACSCGEGNLLFSAEETDIDKTKIAAKNGVIDLQTGDILRGDPNDLITTALPVEYRTTAACPLFLAALLAMMNGSQIMVDYLRRLFGFVLSRSCKENIIVIFDGEGANGKSLLLSLIAKVLGPDLYQTIPSEALMDTGKNRSANAPDATKAGMRGKAIVVAPETNERDAWNESVLKSLSGSDPVNCREPYAKASITFNPSHLLLLATNHLPATTGSFSIRRRIQRVKFPVKFVKNPTTADERLADPNLVEKLSAELPGILTWMVAGCLEWQRDGLNPPDQVLLAVDDYIRQNDILADWREAFLEEHPGARTGAKSLYLNFNEWYKDNIDPDKPVSMSRFGILLSKKYRKDASGPGHTIVYHNIRLKADAE